MAYDENDWDIDPAKNDLSIDKTRMLKPQVVVSDEGDDINTQYQASSKDSAIVTTSLNGVLMYCDKVLTNSIESVSGYIDDSALDLNLPNLVNIPYANFDPQTTRSGYLGEHGISCKRRVILDVYAEISSPSSSIRQDDELVFRMNYPFIVLQGGPEVINSVSIRKQAEDNNTRIVPLVAKIAVTVDEPSVLAMTCQTNGTHFAGDLSTFVQISVVSESAV